MPVSVMIVDDAKFIRIALERVLGSVGFNVVAQAKNGLEAIEEYKKHQPDIVLLDIDLPELDGISTLSKIIAFDPKALVVMCSGYGQESRVAASLRIGAKDFIVKPIDFDRLIESIRRLVYSNEVSDITPTVAEIFARSASEVLETITKFSSKTGIVHRNVELKQYSDINILAEIKDDLEGLILYAFSEPLAKAIASQMLQRPEIGELDEICLSALTELVNIMLAKAMVTLARKGIDIRYVYYSEEMKKNGSNPSDRIPDTMVTLNVSGKFMTIFFGLDMIRTVK